MKFSAEKIATGRTDLLYEMGALFTSGKEITALLNSLLELLVSHMPLERAMILIYDEGRDYIAIDASYGYSEKEVQRGKYRPGEGIVGTVIASGKPFIVPSVKSEPQFLNKTGARKNIDSDTAFISVPVKIKDITIGSISIELRNEMKPPLDRYLETLTTIAIMTSHAINMRREMRLRELELEQENTFLLKKLSDRQAPRKLLGNSTVMQAVYDKVLMVAETDSTVLITGESGTGKELVSDEIHQNSLRKDKPYIKVNIAAIPENLIYSELFGHEKGAFTGAYRQKKGRFEQANGGTIFLDEIGDLGRELQVHLLRVIQEKRIERLGGTDSIPLDVRIITATHQNLEAMIAEGSFRSDLYYRINVFPIHVPPLRDRKADIVLLADFFLERYRKKFNKPISRISTDAIDLLTQHHWPGNVRELENCMERAVIVCDGDVIRNYHLPPSLQSKPQEKNQGSLKQMTDLFLRETIIDTLKQTRGNITSAAKLLGTTKRILNYKIKQLGIDYAKFR